MEEKMIYIFLILILVSIFNIFFDINFFSLTGILFFLIPHLLLAGLLILPPKRKQQKIAKFLIWPYYLGVKNENK